jgi:hypothetical protein
VRLARKRAPHVLVLLTALATALSACGSSSAATPCWKQVLNDWTATQHVKTTYPIACYDQAMKNMGPDLRYYSDAPDAILTAKREAQSRKNARRLQGLGGSSSQNGGPSAGAGGGGGGGNDNGGGGPPQSPASQLLNAGPTSADSLPLPLLFIAGLAILLLAAGAVGVANRHVQARRVPRDDPAA